MFNGSIYQKVKYMKSKNSSTIKLHKIKLDNVFIIATVYFWNRSDGITMGY